MRTFVGRCVVLAIVVAAAGRLAAHDPSSMPLEAPFDAFPRTLGEWRGVDQPPLDAETLRILGADDYLDRLYARPDGALASVYVAYYGAQQQGDSIHSPQHCLPGNGWQPVSRSHLMLDAGGRQVAVNRYVVARGDSRQVVLYWFEGRGRVVASEYWNKWFLLADGLRHGRSEGALVRLVTPVGGPGGDRASERDADARLGQIGTLVHAELERWLP